MWPESSPNTQMLFLFLLLSHPVHAIPVPSSIHEQYTPGPSSPLNSNRSLVHIIWSCLSTVIICTWVSVHPNVPPRSKLSAFLRRMWMMFWTIIAPELVLAWAVRQRYAARMVQREFSDRGWTSVHGHFLIMGGFTLINGNICDEPKEPEKPSWFSCSRERIKDYESRRRQYDKEYRQYNLGPVSFEDFKKLVDNSEIDFPTITVADIEDKSKGDVLSKTLAVIQTSWFLLQCAARIPQRLALTELELGTLALASLNAATYFFWWDKPLQVQESVKLILKKPRDAEGISHPPLPQNKVTLTVRDTLTLIRDGLRTFRDTVLTLLRDPCKGTGPIDIILLIFLVTPIFLVTICFLGFPIAIASLLNFISTDTSNGSQHHRIASQILGRMSLKVTTLVHNYFKRRLQEEGNVKVPMHFFIWLPLLFVIIIIPFIFLAPVLLFTPFLFNSIFNIMSTNTIPPGARHVPSFYATRTTSDRYSRMLVFAFFGVIFGGVHVIGWLFVFPTPFERTLWLATAIIITGIPLIVAPIDFLIEQNISSTWFPEMFLVFVMTILLCIYVPTRLSLIAQAISLLKHQPPSAFASVDWTKFVPHSSTF